MVSGDKQRAGDCLKVSRRKQGTFGSTESGRCFLTVRDVDNVENGNWQKLNWG